MTHSWRIDIPTQKDFTWVGNATTNSGVLALYKDGLTVASKVYGPGNWEMIERTSDDPTANTSEQVASIAARGLSSPSDLTLEEIQSVCASVLSGRAGE